MTTKLAAVGALVVAIGAMGAYVDAQAAGERTTREQQIQQRLEQRLDSRFAKLDTNQDGTVSRNEWRRRPQVFDRLDANHDGVLTKDELNSAVQHRLAKLQQHVQTRVDRRFAKADKNQDGTISRDEWSGQTARFDRLDANHDGVLSKDEIRPALARRLLRRVAARRLLIAR